MTNVSHVVPLATDQFYADDRIWSMAVVYRLFDKNYDFGFDRIGCERTAVKLAGEIKIKHQVKRACRDKIFSRLTLWKEDLWKDNDLQNVFAMFFEFF